MNKKVFTTKNIAIMGVFIALSYLGALIKIPSPTGTVACDSAPGFFCAMAFGPIIGAIVAGIGHIFTAGLTGFPLTLPIHIFIAFTMAITAAVLGIFAKRGHTGLFVGLVLALILNTLVSPLVIIPQLGMKGYYGMLLPLAIGSAINLAIAALVYVPISKSKLLEK